MAVAVTSILRRHSDQRRLDAGQCAATSREVKFVNEIKESKRLDQLRFLSISVSASGMATGRRVLTA